MSAPDTGPVEIDLGVPADSDQGRELAWLRELCDGPLDVNTILLTIAGRLAAQKPLVPHPVLGEVMRERKRQEAKWGVQDHPLWPSARQLAPTVDAIVDYYGVPSERRAKWICDGEAKRGAQTYFSILVEEVAEAVSAQDEAHARAELIQVAAVAVAMCEAIDRRRPACAARAADREEHARWRDLEAVRRRNRDRKSTVYVAGEAVADGQLVVVRIPETDEPKKPEPPVMVLFCDACGKKIPGSWASMGDRCGDNLAGKLHCDGKLGIQKPKQVDLGLTYPAEALRAARRETLDAVMGLIHERREKHHADWLQHCEPQDDGATDALDALADAVEQYAIGRGITTESES